MKNIFSIFLSLLTLAISINPGITYHFCGGKLAQAKIIGFGNADCSMENNRQNCKTHASSGSWNSTAEINKIPCCKNEFQVISTDVYNQTVKNITGFINEFIPFAQYEFSFSENLMPWVGFAFYKPPPILSSVFLPFLKSFRI